MRFAFCAVMAFGVLLGFSGIVRAAENNVPAGALPVDGSVLWLDAADAATIVADGPAVSRWKDKSGAGHDVAQSAEESRPTVGVGTLQGHNVISFDGDSQFFAGPAVLPEGQSQYTFFVVWRSRNIEGSQSVVEQSQAPMAANHRAALLISPASSYGFNGESNDRHDLVPLQSRIWRVTSMQIDNNQPHNVRIVDNNKVFTGSTPHPSALHVAAGGLTIGRKLATDGEYLTGDIAEVVIYSRVLVESDHQKVLAYLAHKWDVDAANATAATSAKISTQILYDETYRPQFHFTAQKNWLNDPNGLVYYAGEYHLFFQHDPRSNNPAHMSWGHAVSTDLLHWKQLDNAIAPDKFGDIWSGSAVVDENNTTGFQTGTEKPIVAIYTAAGHPFTQRISYSIDRGRTWTKYPTAVLPHIIGGDRDPKVIWHAATKQWIMALYLDGQDYALFTSPDLKSFAKLQDVPPFGNGECPDFFPMPVDGNAGTIKWVFSGANGRYVTGDFDGHKFVLDSPRSQMIDWGKNYYAAQTYSGIPAADGRRIQIAWMNGGKYPGMPFNQQMSFPCELTLRQFPEGLRICRTPVKEIELLHETPQQWKDLAVKAGEDPLKDLTGDLFDIRMKIEPGTAAKFGLNIRGCKLAYQVKNQTLTCLGRSTEVPLQDGRITLRVLVDRASIEVFANDGRVGLSSCFVPDPADKSLRFFCTGGTVHVDNMEIFPLRSAWQ
jgi:fructan beta-fructosidase